MQKLGETMSRPERVAERAIVDFFRAGHVELIEHNGALFLAGQFWSTNRAGQRLITSQHIDVTDLAEQIVLHLAANKRGDRE
jgi:enamine deaminase RidA (YjgF/YER057c/UK114 family)